MRTGHLAASIIGIILLPFMLTAPLLAGEQKDPEVGRLTVKVEKEEEPVEARPRLRVVELAAPGRPAAPAAGDWVTAYHLAPGPEPSAAALTTLKVARDAKLGRAGAVNELKNGGEAARPLIKSLDIGRHDLLKWLYARAFVLANQELAKAEKSPLRKVLTVNSGGTGDYTRDQDITAFGGDEVTEKAFFRGLIAAAGELDLQVDPKKTGGIDFPQIEVTIFPGKNDLPDSRFGTDRGEFQLDYIKGVHKQLGDVEAYIGGGADLEVKGRRRPGQVYAQEISFDDEGGVRYRAEVPGNSRETRRLFAIEPRARPEAWQKAAHIFNDLLQGYRHGLHGDDPTKGPLKYAGRAIDYLCSIQGKKPWKDLQPDERRVMLESLFPGQKVSDSLLDRMAEVIDVADEVVRTKKLPGAAKPDLDQKIALIFLKKAVAASAGEMARQAVNPPPFEEGWLDPAQRARWDALDPAQRHEEALKRNQAYRENFSNEAYENLVVTLAMLRRIDLDEARAGRSFHGEAAIRQMIDSADPKLRGVLEDASEYSKLYMELQMAPSPDVREKVRGEVHEARKKLASHLDESSAPGTRILDEIEKMGARNYLEADMAGKRSMPAEAGEIRRRFDEHMRQAFPTSAQEFRDFRTKLQTDGVKSYVAQKLCGELFQLDTIADGLTLVEMYQRGATTAEYQTFIAVNLLSRLHWSFSHLYQASQVRTEADVEALGQNLVFATLCRVVPWAATAKIVFDIGAGTVKVTVGYAINVVNADLVDALYTGAAGRTEDEGEDVGRLRSSGFCILRPEHVLWLENEKTGLKERVIDRPEVYRHFFREWAKLDPEDVPEYSSRKGSLAATHDDLVRVLRLQAANYDRAWVSSSPRKRIEARLKDADVAKALLAFQAAVERHASLAVDKLTAESAVREYRSYFDEEDVIAKGLRERFTADIYMGCLSWWDSWLTARMLAMREIERTAMQADCAAYAALIRESVHEAIVEDTPGIRSLERIQLIVDAKGLSEDGYVFDGSEPVRIMAHVVGRGEVGERNPEIAIRVTPQELHILRKAGKDEKVVEPGDLIEQTVLVQALADQGRGAELARCEHRVKVRMPEENRSTREVSIRKKVWKSRSGQVEEEFTYIESFFGRPSDWGSEDGYVYHGKRELYYSDGTPKETIDYEFGRRDGLHQVFDTEGNWVIREPMVKGKIEGTRIHRDPKSSARMEADHVGGELVEERRYYTNGQMTRRITYERSQAENPEDVVIQGEVLAWWPNGNVRFRGVYRTDRHPMLYIRDGGGYGGETVPGRQGTWLAFHENGEAARKENYVGGLLEGAYQGWNEKGEKVEWGSFRGGARQGRWEYADENGKLDSWAVYDQGRLTGSGRYEDEEN